MTPFEAAMAALEEAHARNVRLARQHVASLMQIGSLPGDEVEALLQSIEDMELECHNQRAVLWAAA
jgi:hypothetical protein